VLMKIAMKIAMNDDDNKLFENATEVK
jgi:hypothetical protein